MPTLNANTTLYGSAGLTVGATEKAQAAASGAAVGSLRCATIQKFVLVAGSQVIGAQGLLDSWRVSNLVDFDPVGLTRVMQTRSMVGTLSTAGEFGND